MRTTKLKPLKTGRKVPKINPKWTDNYPKYTLLDTRNRSCKRVGIRNLSRSNSLVPVWGNLVDPSAKKYEP